MNTCIGKIGIAEKTYYSLLLLNVKAHIDLFLHWVSIFLKAALEYALGIHIGAFIGNISGLHFGNLYVEYFKPAYLFSLEEVRPWQALPYKFAIYGLIFGVIAGSAVIAIINGKLLRQRVAALYEQGVTDPQDMAQTLIKPKWEVQMTIESLLEQENRRN